MDLKESPAYQRLLLEHGSVTAVQLETEMRAALAVGRMTEKTARIVEMLVQTAELHRTNKNLPDAFLNPRWVEVIRRQING